MGPVLEDRAPRPKDLENQHAIGGMRNPKESAKRIPKSLVIGEAVYELLTTACKFIQVQDLVDDLIAGRPAVNLPPKIVELVREQVLSLLAPDGVSVEPKISKADTPLSAEVLWAWGLATGDPDSQVLSSWLQRGAPLGFTEPIPNTGIFPKVDPVTWEGYQLRELAREFEGWENHQSAEEFHADLTELVKEAYEKGFCSFASSIEEAGDMIGAPPLLNKLGLLVKEKDGKRKCRIIWDLKESKSNSLCSQGERVLLPKLSDVSQDILEVFRKGGAPRLLAVDIRDAFHNVPAGVDRAFTTTALPWEGSNQVLIYDVLVFGCVSSPTIWGRFASLLGRSAAAICKQLGLQVYVDDPIITYDVADPFHKTHLGCFLLWAAVMGFPLKLEKSDGGSDVKWIGARLHIHDLSKTLTLTIPAEKISELYETVSRMLSRPVVGRKQLQSLAGALSFVAGIVPLLRPFLAGLWAVLTTTNDGATRARNLVHTCRIAPALKWVSALLKERRVPLTRTVRAFRVVSEAIVITDASTWGMGGVLFVRGLPVEYFSCPIPYEFCRRTGCGPGKSKHMALWESLCLLLAARTWLTRFPCGSVVRVKSDNIAALYLLLKGKAKAPELSMVAREIALDQALDRYEFTLLSHINTKLNRTSDPLSRQFDPSPPVFPTERLGHAKCVSICIDASFWQLS